jgi:hypothetical protein
MKVPAAVVAGNLVAGQAPSAIDLAPWRRGILTLLFLTTTICNLDRIVLAVLIPVIRARPDFSDRG